MVKLDENKIKQEAREILDKFAKALEKVKEEPDFYVNRAEFEREEKSEVCKDKGFKQKLLENAGKKDNDFVIAEKGSWK